MFWGNFTPEQIAEWTQQQQAKPDERIIVKEVYKCDSCHRFFSKFNSYVEFGSKYCHMYDSCLDKFREKYWQHTDFCSKPPEQQEGM